jgi:hypothetical protein
MNRWTLYAVSTLLLTLGGCRSRAKTAPVAIAGDAGAADRHQKARPSGQRLSRQQAVDDARQMIRLLEETHPDPYSPMNGKIAFKRKARALVGAIPADGLTAVELARRLQTFLAGLGDGHTALKSKDLDWYAAEPSVAVAFEICSAGLYLSGFNTPALQGTRGFKLTGVNGVPVDRLIARLSRLTAVENRYHAYAKLARAVVSRELLARLIEGLTPETQIRYGLEGPGGKRVSRSIRAAKQVAPYLGKAPSRGQRGST